MRVDRGPALVVATRRRADREGGYRAVLLDGEADAAGRMICGSASPVCAGGPTRPHSRCPVPRCSSSAWAARSPAHSPRGRSPRGRPRELEARPGAAVPRADGVGRLSSRERLAEAANACASWRASTCSVRLPSTTSSSGRSPFRLRAGRRGRRAPSRRRRSARRPSVAAPSRSPSQSPGPAGAHGSRPALTRRPTVRAAPAASDGGRRSCPLRIVFAGNARRRRAHLDRLADSPHDVVGVVTRPPAPLGRKRVLAVTGRAGGRAARDPGDRRAAPRRRCDGADRRAATRPGIVAYGRLVREPLLSTPPPRLDQPALLRRCPRGAGSPVARAHRG